MKFLIDENLPRSSSNIISRYGYKVEDVRDIGLKGASDHEIAVYARENNLCLVTGDKDFSVMRNYPPDKFHGIIVLKTPVVTSAVDILKMLEGVIKKDEIISGVKGKLIIVDKDHIRIKHN